MSSAVSAAIWSIASSSAEEALSSAALAVSQSEGEAELSARLVAGLELLAVGVAWLAERWVGLEDLSMVFIVAVVLVAAAGPAINAVLAFCAALLVHAVLAGQLVVRMP